MSKLQEKKWGKENVIKAFVFAFCGLFVVLEFIPIQYTKDADFNGWIGRILSNTCAIIAVVGLMEIMQIKAFKKPQALIYILPAVGIALANFPLVSYLNGNMQLVRDEAWAIVLFVTYCLSVGVLEELIFRGILFSTLANRFSQDRKGLIKAFVYSSVIFGLAHLTNLLRGAGFVPTILQAIYTTLTGGLFCYVLIKTKNLLCCAGIHALYNVCGLIFETPARLGLGTGVVFDLGTGILMAAIDVCLGIFVLYATFNHKDEDRVELYDRLRVNGN